MEIKCVKKEKVKYPKINEISNTRVKYAIPDKWLKLGITSFLFNVLMQEKVFATNLIEISPDDIILAGGYANPDYNPIYSHARGVCNIVSLVSVLAIIISSIMIIVKKAKAKKQGENAKVSKKIKIVFIISIILLILSRIGYVVANYYYLGDV